MILTSLAIIAFKTVCVINVGSNVIKTGVAIAEGDGKKALKGAVSSVVGCAGVAGIDLIPFNSDVLTPAKELAKGTPLNEALHTRKA